MTIRTWFKIIILLACAFGAYGELYHASSAFSTQYWQHYFYLISPWLLFYGSLKAWYQNFIWRRMLNNRQTSPVLSRGGQRMEKSILGPNILEHSCGLLFLLAVTAILKQRTIPHIEWWIGSLIGTWFSLRIIVRGIK